MLLIALVQRTSLAGDITVSGFGAGLNTQDNPAEIDPSAAQDLLNVNIQPGGGAVFKREGYGLFQSVGVSTSAIHGGYHFQQVGGNDVQLWGSDQYLSGSVNDASFVRLATGTLAATWQCVDSQGFAYCLSSSRDTCVKTDGSSANTSYQTGVPLGTMLTFTPTQLVVAGVSGNESTLYISQQNTFTTFTVGVLPSSAFTEPIASPGSRITHLAYYFGKLFWWKDQSFGYATFTNQNDWQLTIVSNSIGTLDNSDAFWNSSGFDSGSKFTGTAQASAGQSPGGIFFRGQDNHFYVYDGYYLTRISRPITPTITAANRKKANAWTQTTQADFANGTSFPTGSLSTSISPGDVVPSSFSVTENSSAQWNNDAVTNITINANSLTLSTNNSGNITNPDFESSFSGNWTTVGNWQASSGVSGNGCASLNPQHGSQMALDSVGSPSITSLLFEAIDLNSNLIKSVSETPTNDCTWRQDTLTPTTQTGMRVKFRFHCVVSNGDNQYLTTSDSYIWGGPITFYWASGNVGIHINDVFVDNVQAGSSTITSGSLTSQIFDTHQSTPTIQLQTSWTANTFNPTFELQGSNNQTAWTKVLTATGTSTTVADRYFRYLSTFTITSADSALTTLTSASIIARSSGTYYSAVKNAPNLSSWGTMGIDDTTGDETITYFTRSSTNAFTVASATPTWVAQTKNALVAASTGTYLQLRADFTEVTATNTPALNDFAFNWFEGSAADKSYIGYFNDAIWFSVSSSSSVSTNNRIFYWDLLNGAWLIYDIAANGFQIENNSLYFGDPTAGKIYKFGGVPTDNGNPINSYWRSKTFLGQDPFVQNEFLQADFILGQSSTTLSYTYTLDSKTSTVFTMTAYDPSASLIQRNFLLPVGKIGKYYDFKIGDNSSSPAWRLMGHKMHYNALNWKPVLN